jgi:hypothetical protein
MAIQVNYLLENLTQMNTQEGLFGILKNNPALWEYYLIMCAHNEHFLYYRQIVRDKIEIQVEEYLAQQTQVSVKAKEGVLVS